MTASMQPPSCQVNRALAKDVVKLASFFVGITLHFAVVSHCQFSSIVTILGSPTLGMSCVADQVNHQGFATCDGVHPPLGDRGRAIDT